MNEPSFQFEVVTVNGKPYAGKVTSLVVPGEKGSFGVLANHAAFISTCTPGKLKAREQNGSEFWFEVGGGFFEVAKNRAILLTNSFEKINLA